MLPNAVQLEEIDVELGGKTVLDGVSLTVRRGEKVRLTGPSGSGKTTVLRCVLGFVVPQSGRILVDGQELTPDTVWDLRQRLAYVAQEPELGDGTVREILERPFTYRANRMQRDNLERIPDLFERLYLPQGLLDADAGEISGGEKQRVALVSAMLLDRTIFLLDEASSALDRRARDAVVDVFRSEPDWAVLAVSHEDEWQAFSERDVTVD